MEISKSENLRGLGSKLFPKDVIVKFAEVQNIQGELLPEEQSDIQYAVDSRRKQYLCGRVLAHKCMLDLTGEAHWNHFPLKKGPQKEPLWPETFSGCIAHTKNICGVALAQKSNYPALGLDIENLDRPGLSLEIQRHILTPSEREYYFDLPETDRPNYLIKTFSAKESIYKGYFPRVQQFFGFQEASLIWDDKTSTFEGTFANPFAEKFGLNKQLQGKFTVALGHVFTSIVVD